MERRSHQTVYAIALRVMLLVVVTPLFFMRAPVAGAQVVNPQLITSQVFEQVLARGDFATMAAILSPEVVTHSPDGEFRGYLGMQDFSAILGGAFSDVSFATADPTVGADTMAIRWTLSGKHMAPYQGISATCAFVSIPGTAIFRLDGTKVVEQWFDYDRLAVVDQLEALSAVDTHSEAACATSPAPALDAPVSDATIPVCGPDCDKPRGNR